MANQPAGVPIVPVVFALSPALANRDVLDYSSAAGAKVYRGAIAPIAIEFDCKSENLQLFLDQVRDRVTTHDWNDILLIPKDGNLANPKDLIESYGEVSYEDVKASAMQYVNTETREAQDSVMLYQCIMASLTKEAQRQVRIRGKGHPFQIAGHGVGALLLKVVIMVSHVDTRATISSVRTKLSSLDKSMREFDSDIEKFNDYVVELENKLQARGQVTQDLLVNLFKGYKVCKDLEFVEYIKKKEDYYEEGGDVTSDQLMEWALNKFKSRKESNTWCQKTNEEETIIALQAQVQSLIKGAGAKATGNHGTKDQKGKTKKTKKDNKPAWMLVAPAEGEPQTKTVDGKTWNWCPTHKAWVRHTAATCKGIGFRASGGGKEQKQTSKEGPKMKISKALEAVDSNLEDDEDEDSNDDED